MTTTVPITLTAGNDTITAGSTYAGNTISTSLDYIVNGDNNGDTINFAKSTAANYLSGGTGNDLITGSKTGINTLFTGGGNDTLIGGNGNGDQLTVNGTGNNTLTDGNGNGDIISVNAAGNNTITVGNGKDSIFISAAGNDTVTVGTGADLINIAGGSTTSITNLGQGSDTLDVVAGSTAIATISSKGYTATAASENLGTATLTTSGHAVNLSAITTGNGFTILDSKGKTSLTGTASAADTITGAAGDTITGGTGADTFNIITGVETVKNLGNGADTLVVSSGATVNATVTAAWTATSASVNNGTATLTTSGYGVNLSAITTGKGFAITDSKGHATLIGTASGNDSITGATGDTITVGSGADLLTIKGIETITNLGMGNDTLVVSAGATATATIVSSGWTATATSMNSGKATLDTAGHTVNLSAITKGSGFTIDDSVGGTTLTGTASAADTIIGAAGDTLTGGTGADHFMVYGTETITDLGKGADSLIVESGATVTATVTANWTATSATVNHGTATIVTAGYTVNLAAATKADGFTIENTGGGAAKLTASAGNDTIIAGTGADSIVGGKGTDTFEYSAGHSTYSAHDTITGFSKGTTGDIIQYSSALTIGGSNVAATATDASINATTGVASFATGEGKTLSTAVTDIVNAFVDHGGDKAGDFAFFQVNKTGPEYLFISDGLNTSGAGADHGSTLIQLVGVTSVNGITLSGDHLSIAS